MINLAKIVINRGEHSLIINFNVYFVLAIVFITIGYVIWKKHSMHNITKKMVPVEVTIGSENTIKYSIERNDKNVEVAYRIYIELVTRKAAIEIDPDNDVIEEVYNSWYQLFGIIREELKTLPALFLREGLGNNDLIEFTLKILNNGLRPHLTQYQADFRSWYDNEKGKNSINNLSPQQLQRLYPRYSELTTDMIRVNKVLIDYAHELLKLIKGVI